LDTVRPKRTIEELGKSLPRSRQSFLLGLQIVDFSAERFGGLIDSSLAVYRFVCHAYSVEAGRPRYQGLERRVRRRVISCIHF
jgi:hypothetical protein